MPTSSSPSSPPGFGELVLQGLADRRPDVEQIVLEGEALVVAALDRAVFDLRGVDARLDVEALTLL